MHEPIIASVCGRTVASFREVVSSLPVEAVASPRRSTVPLIDYWREPGPRLTDLWNRINYQPSGPVQLHFEHEVPVQAGRGKPSYTDLMVIADDIAVAIEAKYTEPRYESVREWLARSHSSNRGEVLDGWLGTIASVTGARIARTFVSDLPYQAIHRTASACCVSRSIRFVIYQVFGEAPAAHYAQDLARLAAAISAGNRITFLVLKCAFDATEVYRQLDERWQSGERQLGEEVRKALLAGPLLTFREPVMMRILPAASE